MTAVAGGPEAL